MGMNAVIAMNKTKRTAIFYLVLLFKHLEKNLIRHFIFSASILLALSAIAKLVSACGAAAILERHEPLFGLSYRLLFIAAGSLEFAMAVFCFLAKSTFMRVGIIVWLSTIILIYRLSMPVVGYHQACPCLGNVTEMLHVSAHAANIVMKFVLAYLLSGSYLSPHWLWRQREEISASRLA